MVKDPSQAHVSVLGESEYHLTCLLQGSEFGRAAAGTLVKLHLALGVAVDAAAVVGVAVGVAVGIAVAAVVVVAVEAVVRLSRPELEDPSIDREEPDYWLHCSTLSGSSFSVHTLLSPPAPPAQASCHEQELPEIPLGAF